MWGKADSTNGWRRIRQRMKYAEQLLRSEDDVTGAKLTQEQVVREIDDIIQRLEAAMISAPPPSTTPQNQPQQQQGTPQPQSGDPSEPQSGQTPRDQSGGATEVRGGNRDATESELQEREQRSEGMLGDDPNALMRRLWGQLPARRRQQLLQTPTGEFLPSYREDIEAYYRELARQAQEE